MATPSRPPARPRTPVSIDEVLRQSPTLQTNAAQILMDSRLRQARYTAAARSFDNLGWYLGTSGVGLLYLPDGAALPDRLSFGLPSLYTGAVASWPGGVWVGTDRTSLTDATLTYVDSELREFRTVQGPPASGTPFTRILDLAGQGSAVWAATDRGVARVNPTEGRIEIVDETRGLPDSRVFDLSTRQGRVTVGTAHGVARVGERLEVERIAPQFVDPAYAVYPDGDSVWVGTSRGVLVGVADQPDLLRPSGMASAGFDQPVLALVALADTLVGLGRDQLLWRNPGRSMEPGRAAFGRARAAAPLRGGPVGVVGGRGSGSRLRPAQRARPAGAPRGRPAGTVQRPRGGRDLSLGRHRRGTGALPSRRYPAVSDGPALGPGVEFDRIRAIASALGRQASGLGDDCALLSGRADTLAVSTDASVEGVHFRLDWLSHEEVGLAGRRGGALRSRGRRGGAGWIPGGGHRAAVGDRGGAGGSDARGRGSRRRRRQRRCSAATCRRARRGP